MLESEVRAARGCPRAQALRSRGARGARDAGARSCYRPVGGPIAARTRGGRRRIPCLAFDDHSLEMLGDTVGPARSALHARLLCELDPARGLAAARAGPPVVASGAAGTLSRGAGRGARRRRRSATSPRAATPIAERWWMCAPAPVARGVVEPREVAALVELDAPLGDDDRALRDALRTAASSGIHGRTAGEDSPRWTVTASQAGSAAKALPAGSAGAHFCLGLQEMARVELNDDRRADAEERHGWH